MLTKTQKISNSVLAVLIAIFILYSQPAFAKPQVLRLQCAYNETTTGGELTKKFADRIEAYTDGQVKVKVFWPGQLVKIGDAYKSLGTGMIQGLAAASIYFGGILPEVKTEMMPFAWKSSEDALNLFYNKGFNDILREAHREKNVYFPGSVFAGTMAFLTNFPVNSLDDFKGKKIRAMSTFAKLAAEIELVPISMPNTDMYMALKTGVIDSTVFTLDSIEKFKFFEVINNVVLPGIFNPVPMGLYLNNAWFEALPAETRKKIDKACYDTAVESIAYCKTSDESGLEVARKENLTITTLSDQDLEALRKIASKGWDEIAAISPRCKKLVDLIKDNLKN